MRNFVKFDIFHRHLAYFAIFLVYNALIIRLYECIVLLLESNCNIIEPL